MEYVAKAASVRPSRALGRPLFENVKTPEMRIPAWRHPKVSSMAWPGSQRLEAAGSGDLRAGAAGRDDGPSSRKAVAPIGLGRPFGPKRLTTSSDQIFFETAIMRSAYQFGYVFAP